MVLLLIRPRRRLIIQTPSLAARYTLPPTRSCRAATVASTGVHCHSRRMFVVPETDAIAIRAIFHKEGELSAAIELRRRFPGVSDNAKARACARTIAGWSPLPARAATVTWLRSRKDA